MGTQQPQFIAHALHAPLISLERQPDALSTLADTLLHHIVEIGIDTQHTRSWAPICAPIPPYSKKPRHHTEWFNNETNNGLVIVSASRYTNVCSAV